MRKARLFLVAPVLCLLLLPSPAPALQGDGLVGPTPWLYVHDRQWWGVVDYLRAYSEDLGYSETLLPDADVTGTPLENALAMDTPNGVIIFIGEAIHTDQGQGVKVTGQAYSYNDTFGIYYLEGGMHGFELTSGEHYQALLDILVRLKAQVVE